MLPSFTVAAHFPPEVLHTALPFQKQDSPHTRISTMVCHTASLSGWLCTSIHQGCHLPPHSALPCTCLILVCETSRSPNIPTAHHYLELSLTTLKSGLSHHAGINFSPWHTRSATRTRVARKAAVLSQRYKNRQVGKGNTSKIFPEASSLLREVKEKTKYFVIISFTLQMTSTLKP